MKFGHAVSKGKATGCCKRREEFAKYLQQTNYKKKKTEIAKKEADKNKGKYNQKKKKKLRLNVSYS